MHVDTYTACRSPVLVHLDLCIFSMLLSRSLMYEFFDIAGCFVFFYIWFCWMHATSLEHSCTPQIKTAYTTMAYINDTEFVLA